MCDISLEREQVQIGLPKHQRQTFAKPYPLISDRLEGTYIFAAHFMFGTYQEL